MPKASSLRESTYFLLAALLDGPLHGYAIIARAEELSDGRVKLAAGTLYGALDRLLGEGLVAVEGEEIVSGRARRTTASPLPVRPPSRPRRRACAAPRG